MVKLPVIIYQPLHNLSTLLFIIRQVFLPQKLRLVDQAQLFSFWHTWWFFCLQLYKSPLKPPNTLKSFTKGLIQIICIDLFSSVFLVYCLVSWAHLVSFCNPQQLPKPNPFNTRDVNKPFTGRSRKLLCLLKKHYRHLPNEGGGGNKVSQRITKKPRGIQLEEKIHKQPQRDKARL